jgi:nitroreductase
MWQPNVEMTVYEAILARRSVRNYSSRGVGRGTIRTLLEAAVCAPTALYENTWAFVIIQDKAVLHQLSEHAKPFLSAELSYSGMARTRHRMDSFTRPDFNIFYDAGTLIVIGARVKDPFVAADCWLASENLMLAACAMGLGTCVIGSALPALNVAGVKAELGIPDKFFAIAPIVVGYPSGETAPFPRKPPVVLTHLPLGADQPTPGNHQQGGSSVNWWRRWS